MFIDFRVKCFLFCQVFMKLEFSQQVFEKYSNLKFPVNPFNGSRFVHVKGRSEKRADRQRDRQLQRWTDLKKLLVAFRNFVNAPNKDI
jgi:hypothetical protein